MFLQERRETEDLFASLPQARSSRARRAPAASEADASATTTASPEDTVAALGHYAEPVAIGEPPRCPPAPAPETKDADDQREVWRKLPESHDVSTVTKADLDKVRASDPEMAKAIERAKIAYANNIADGARVVITTSAGNGGKPVAMLIPAGFDPKEEVRLQTHFHGDKSTSVDVVGDGGVSGRILDMQRDDPQKIVILPECQNAQYAWQPGGKTPSYSANWDNVKDLAQTQEDALLVAGALKGVAKGGYTVSAHSGGGHGVMQAMKNDLARGCGEPSKIHMDHLELLDCIHYNDGDRRIENTIVDWAKVHGSEVETVLGVRGTMGEEKDWNAIRDAFGPGKYTGIDVHPGREKIRNPAWKPGSKEPFQIPNPEYRKQTSVPTDPDARGTPQPRWTDPHGRARSEYMGQDHRDHSGEMWDWLFPYDLMF